MNKKRNLLVMLVCLLALGSVLTGCPTDANEGTYKLVYYVTGPESGGSGELDVPSAGIPVPAAEGSYVNVVVEVWWNKSWSSLGQDYLKWYLDDTLVLDRGSLLTLRSSSLEYGFGTPVSNGQKIKAEITVDDSSYHGPATLETTVVIE